MGYILIIVRLYCTCFLLTIGSSHYISLIPSSAFLQFCTSLTLVRPPHIRLALFHVVASSEIQSFPLS